MYIAKRLDRWLIVVWLTLIVVIPLGFNLYSRRVFEPEKAFVLKLVAFLLVSLWAVYFLSVGLSRDGIRRVSTWRQPRVYASIAALCLMAIVVFATLSSVEPRVSWTGSYEWRQGTFTFLACLIVFLAAAWQPRLERWQGPLIAAMELTCLIVAGYGVLQYFGLDLVRWYPAIEGRVFSTLGHPNFLAAYLVLVVPIIGSCLLSATSWRARVFHGAVLITGLLCLYLTFSRSGWLGLLAAVGFVVILQIRLSPLRYWWLGIVVLGLVALVVLGLLAYLDPGGLFSFSPLEPIHSFLRGKSATAHVRALTWSSVWALIWERPVLGFGPETFRLAFPRALPPMLTVYGGAVAAGGHAHNELLDWTLNTGLLGLAAYVSWFLAVMLAGLSSIPRLADKAQRLLLMGLMAAMVGYVVQNQLSFATITAMSYFWMISGLVVSVAQSAITPPAVVHSPVPGKNDAVQASILWNKLGLGIAVTIVALLLLFAVLIPQVFALRADVHAQMAWNAVKARDWEKAVSQYQTALYLEPAQDRYWQSLAETYMALALNERRRAPELFSMAEECLQKAITLSPLDVSYRTSLGALYYEWGVSGQSDQLALALEAYRQAVAMSPSDPQLWSRWGRVYHALGQFESAIEKYDEALSLNPLHVQAYSYLGEAYLALQRIEDAREVYATIDQVTADLDRMVSKR